MHEDLLNEWVNDSHGAPHGPSLAEAGVALRLFLALLRSILFDGVLRDAFDRRSVEESRTACWPAAKRPGALDMRVQPREDTRRSEAMGDEEASVRSRS